MAPYWKIEYYVSEGGMIPFELFIRRLKTREARADCAALLKLLELRGDTLDGVQHLTHKHGLRELRDEGMRIFYLCDGDTVVVIDGLLPAHGKDLSDIYRKAEDYGSDDENSTDEGRQDDR